MQMKSQRGRVFRSGNWAKESRDTEKKSRRNAQSAGPPKYKRSAKILGTSQLL